MLDRPSRKRGVIMKGTERVLEFEEGAEGKKRAFPNIMCVHHPATKKGLGNSEGGIHQMSKQNATELHLQVDSLTVTDI